jgi:hypothetical protein
MSDLAFKIKSRHEASGLTTHYFSAACFKHPQTKDDVLMLNFCPFSTFCHSRRSSAALPH